MIPNIKFTGDSYTCYPNSLKVNLHNDVQVSCFDYGFLHEARNFPLFLFVRYMPTFIHGAGVMAKSTCSSQGPQFDSQHTIKWLLTICHSSSRASNAYSDFLGLLYAHSAHIHNQVHTNTHTYLKKTS